MGVFITGVVSSREFMPNLEPYTGALFSTVGVVICIWQFLISRTTVGKTIARSPSYLLYAVLISALFFLGDVVLSFFAIIAYGLFESIVIPLCYQKVQKYHSQTFAVLLVLCNIGNAIGSFITGVVISQTGVLSTYILMVIVFRGINH